MKHYRGLLNESYVDQHAKLFEPPHIESMSIAVPKSLDWREYGQWIHTNLVFYAKCGHFRKGFEPLNDIAILQCGHC